VREKLDLPPKHQEQS